jgi:hypothetical protein
MANCETTLESAGNYFLRGSLIEWYDADPQRWVATLDSVIWTETRATGSAHVDVRQPNVDCRTLYFAVSARIHMGTKLSPKLGRE